MNHQEDDVIYQLYQASAGLLPWPVALATLGAAMDALICQFLTIEKATGRLVVCEQPPDTVVDAALDYIREYHRIDPHAVHIAAMDSGALLNTESTFPRALMSKHRFYREFWQPYSVRGLLASKVGDDNDQFSLVSVVRTLDQPSFNRAEEARAARFFRHLVNATHISRHNLEMRVVGNVGKRMMEASARPMFLLGEGMRLIAVNGSGTTCLDRGNVFRERGGVIGGSTEAGRRLLAQEFGRIWNAVDAGRRGALRLPGSDADVALCLLWNLSPASTMGAFGSERSVLLSIADSRVAGPIDSVFLASMLDLTPAEARVAALIAFGSSLNDIAAELHVSVHTVRTQLKTVFAKTGCQRQVQLSNLINDLRG